MAFGNVKALSDIEVIRLGSANNYRYYYDKTKGESKDNITIIPNILDNNTIPRTVISITTSVTYNADYAEVIVKLKEAYVKHVFDYNETPQGGVVINSGITPIIAGSTSYVSGSSPLKGSSTSTKTVSISNVIAINYFTNVYSNCLLLDNIIPKINGVTQKTIASPQITGTYGPHICTDYHYVKYSSPTTITSLGLNFSFTQNKMYTVNPTYVVINMIAFIFGETEAHNLDVNCLKLRSL